MSGNGTVTLLTQSFCPLISTEKIFFEFCACLNVLEVWNVLQLVKEINTIK